VGRSLRGVEGPRVLFKGTDLSRVKGVERMGCPTFLRRVASYLLTMASLASVVRRTLPVVIFPE
jgi:hypothetical protein